MTRIKALYQEYPPQFWLLMFGMFIDRTGGALLFTFFSLYITKKFNVGMVEAGIVFLIFSVAGMFSSFVGGALTDRMGRKRVVLFGLLASASSSLVLAFINDLMVFYIAAVFVGLLEGVGHPAGQAMIADLLPEQKRAEGFGILRVIMNLAVVIGPMFGALLAAYSFLYLFIADALTSLITASILLFFLGETMPQAKPATIDMPAEPRESMRETFKGYSVVFKDKLFIAFISMGVLAGMVYTQMYSTLSVFLRDTRGFPAEGFGFVMSMNAAMVVLMQFWITRKIRVYPALVMMALGSAFYAVGFGMYGFATTVPLFYVAMAIITLGEMVALPVSHALVARFAPENMRGRYMAIYGMSWSIPNGFGPILAGVFMQTFAPELFWYVCAVAASVAAWGYISLYRSTRDTAIAYSMQKLKEELDLSAA